MGEIYSKIKVSITGVNQKKKNKNVTIVTRFRKNGEKLVIKKRGKTCVK
jgi:hypothetical protein